MVSWMYFPTALLRSALEDQHERQRRAWADPIHFQSVRLSRLDYPLKVLSNMSNNSERLSRLSSQYQEGSSTDFEYVTFYRVTDSVSSFPLILLLCISRLKLFSFCSTMSENPTYRHGIALLKGLLELDPTQVCLLIYIRNNQRNHSLVLNI